MNKQAEQQYFKFLNRARTGGYSTYRWPDVGEWNPRISEPLMMCKRGYHILSTDQLVGPYMLQDLYEVVWTGDILRDEEKCAVQQAKLIRKIEAWNERTARIFAADCAERVLPIYERRYPHDDRIALCIKAARDFAKGEISQSALIAAGDAAGAAAWAAAGAAAWAAAGDAAGAAAWAAAGDAAWAAAGAAAWAAAGDAERKWQNAHLRKMLGL